RILHAMELLRSAGLADDAEVEVRTRLQLETLPITSNHLYLPPRKRTEAPEREVEFQPPDPALLRYLEAVDEFEQRIVVTPERLERYVDATLHMASEAGASAFPVPDLEHFLLYERLHEISQGELAGKYEMLLLEGGTVNDWVERRNFVIRRREPTDG